MPEHISGRALATALGVTEKSVRKAVEAGRIRKEDDGKFELNTCRTAWGRTTDPARSKVRTTADHPGPRSAPTVRAPLPQADNATLWSIVAELPALVAWSITLGGGGPQLAQDVAADLALDVSGELRLRGFAPPSIAYEAIDWNGLAKEAGLDPIDPKVMAADYARRRA